MVDDATLKAWFFREVLPLEASLMRFLHRNSRDRNDVIDIRQEVYASALKGARQELPQNTAAYVHVIARNLLINRAKRASVISFEVIADLEGECVHGLAGHSENQMVARDELRRVQKGLDLLPPRCREVVRLRKVEGFSTRETAAYLNISVDTVEKQITLGMRALTDFMLGGHGRIERPKPAAAGEKRKRVE